MSLLDKLKGKAKETAGGTTGSDSLREEGQAQQRKADEESRADTARREAELHEQRAERHEDDERRRQGT
jgi:uncharacterized protein YjbJ (UPF0337 family)